MRRNRAGRKDRDRDPRSNDRRRAAPPRTTPWPAQTGVDFKDSSSRTLGRSIALSRVREGCRRTLVGGPCRSLRSARDTFDIIDLPDGHGSHTGPSHFLPVRTPGGLEPAGRSAYAATVPGEEVPMRGETWSVRPSVKAEAMPAGSDGESLRRSAGGYRGRPRPSGRGRGGSCPGCARATWSGVPAGTGRGGWRDRG